eukprot:SAG22_NODE_2068_length_3054_cov_2.135025_2_plen_91_part_00
MGTSQSALGAAGMPNYPYGWNNPTFDGFGSGSSPMGGFVPFGSMAGPFHPTSALMFQFVMPPTLPAASSAGGGSGSGSSPEMTSNSGQKP